MARFINHLSVDLKSLHLKEKRKKGKKNKTAMLAVDHRVISPQIEFNRFFSYVPTCDPLDGANFNRKLVKAHEEMLHKYTRASKF